VQAGRGIDDSGGYGLAKFTEALCHSSTIDELERRFSAGLGPLLQVPMYGFNILDRETWRPEHNTAVNVSELFVSRYEQAARDVDPVLEHALETGHAAYNLALMSEEEWLESPAYVDAYRTHSMRHVIDTPVIADGEPFGSLHVADDDPGREITARDTRAVEMLGHVLGSAIEGIRERDRLELERDQALRALELTGTAVVFSDPGAVELRANDAARRLLARVVDAEEELHRLIATRPDEGGFSRRVEIELADGARGTLHAHSCPPRAEGGGLVTVLELDREDPGIAPSRLGPLTPREREVALLVVDGLADREIAERLCLSHHTVSQYVKRIYRKLDVESRVALTRVLLGPLGSARRD
jgi:DNA-binding CsgD family transcriptional regulator/GAF domain-containing protein